MKLEAMEPVIRGELPLKVHAHRADDIFTAIRIAKEFGIRLMLDHCTDGGEIAQYLAKEGYPALVGPSLGKRSKEELQHKSFCTPGVLHAAGVKVCIISDANVVPLEYLPMYAGLAAVEGLPMEEAWKAITINPAEVMGIADRVGSLEPGKDGDVVIWTADPLTTIGGRAYTTIRKQESLWKNHLASRFGKKFVDELTPADVNDYLAELYYKKKLSYRYVEAFLKMFYLFFGQAYSRNYMDVDTYNKLCVNKSTKITMPKLKSDDDTDIVAFSQEELLLLDDYFRGTNAETAYMLGRYCGLRINECFGLKWANVDLEKGTILIDRQMQYQEGLIKLVPPKTKNATRTIYMCASLRTYLLELYRKRQEDEVRLGALREQKRRLIEDMDGTKIYSTELVNCLPNGTIQTVNSFKHPSREIKKRFRMEFKYHYLRHTYGTMMAEMNTPTHLLCNQMGHGKIQVTQQYYIAVSKSGIDILQKNLDRL
jgi:integrase